MKNSELNSQENLKKEDSFVEQQVSISTNEMHFNQNLTNEEKLEHLSKLIQDANQNLESNGINKKLVK